MNLSDRARDTRPFIVMDVVEKAAELVRLGLSIIFSIQPTPAEAFYVFVNASHIWKNSYELAFDILEKAKVGVARGIDFRQNGEGYLRFSYANSMENIEEGMNRLETYFRLFKQG